MAGHLKVDLYVINLAAGDISDGKLHSMFLSLPKKSVVIIEDIDSAGIGREGEEEDHPDPRRKRMRNKVTLSGLLKDRKSVV